MNAPMLRDPLWRAFLTFVVIYTVGMCVYLPFRAQRSTDFRDYWRTALAFRETGEVRSDLGVHNYLPAFVVLMTPWSVLPLQVSIVIFALLSMALWVATLHMMVRLVGEGAERAVLIGAFLTFPYVHSCVTLGAIELVLLFLIVACAACVRGNRPGLGGAALGLAIALKMLPVVLLAPLVLAGRWKAVAASVACGVALIFALPALAVGWPTTAQLHSDFAQRLGVVKADHSGEAPRAGGPSTIEILTAEKPRKAVFSNISLPMVLRGLLTPIDRHPRENEPPLRVNVADLPVVWVGVIYAALLACVGIATLWRSRGCDLLNSYGLWCAVMLLVSPLVWTRYLLLACLPVVLIVRSGLQNKSAPARRASIAALSIWGLGIILLAWPAARAAGAQLAGLAAIWAALLMIEQRPARPLPAWEPHAARS